MADRRIPLRTLRRILKSYGVSEDSSRGKGSHTYFFKQFSDGEFGYPIPTHDKDVAKSYVKGVRKALRLTEKDGTSDKDFYAAH